MINFERSERIVKLCFLQSAHSRYLYNGFGYHSIDRQCRMQTNVRRTVYPVGNQIPEISMTRIYLIHTETTQIKKPISEFQIIHFTSIFLLKYIKTRLDCYSVIIFNFLKTSLVNSILT